jgi:hypothetical protein
MIFKWETQKERLLRFMAIPPKKKLEWLSQMHEFIRLAWTKKRRDIFWKLRQSR